MMDGPTPDPDERTRWTPPSPPARPAAPGYQVPPSWQGASPPTGPPATGQWGQVPPMPPPGMFPPGAPRGNRGLAWALLGTVCVLAVTAVVLTLIFTGDRQSSETATQTTTSVDKAAVPASAIDGLLPAKDTLASAVDDPGLGLIEEGNRMGTATPVEADCGGMNSSSAGSVYGGSGWTAVRWQRWRSPPEPDAPTWKHEIVLSVVTYPQAKLAGDFYAKQAATWKRCANRTVNMRFTDEDDTADYFWSVGEVTDSGGVLKTTVTNEGSDGWTCQNVMVVHNNVVSRVGACGYTLPDAPDQPIIDAIAEKIDAAA